MSLLNQMLRDLEKRQASPAIVGGGVLQDVLPAHTSGRVRRRNRFAQLRWLGLAALALAAGHWAPSLFNTNPSAILETPLQVSGEKAAAQLQTPAPGGFESLQLEARLSLPESGPARANRPAAGSPAVAEPQDSDAPLLQRALRPRAPALEPPAPLRVRSPMVIEKSVSPADHQQQMQTQYSQALQLIDAQRQQEADQLLLEITQTWPGYTQARILLISRMLANGELGSAAEILQRGLRQAPDNIALVGLKARLLAANGQVAAAVRELRGVSPDLHNHLDHYVLLAALLRQVEDYAGAIEVYQALLELRADRGVWWMGLAVSLDATGQSDHAVAAYREALGKADMTPALSDYARQQLQP